ncbi:MAG: pilus assembly protein PilM [Proteobacteria bacterium]|nr:pilus assembly protein PilM [Pseudomonadota bacterium]
MSQRVFGIDLGAHSVKVAELEVGFRTVHLARLQTLELPPGAGSALTRGLQVLGDAVSVGPGDLLSVGLPGDRVLMRLLDVPFTDARRVHALVGSELADDLPWELDELVFDQRVVRAGGKGLAGQALVGAARRDELSELVAQLAQAGLAPQGLIVAASSYGSLLRRLGEDQTVLIVDLGHLHTNLALLVAGQTMLARSISRGGHQITEALRSTFQLDYHEAEQFKHAHARVVDDPQPLGASERRVAQMTAQAIAPVVGEVRRTLELAASRLGLQPDRVLLCGGTAQLQGLSRYLAIELERPVELLSLAADPDLGRADLTPEAQLVGALPLALALEHGRRQALDLRRDELAFQTSRSLAREKALPLGIGLGVVLLLAALSVGASLNAVRTEHAALSAELQRSTRRVLGEAVRDPELATRRVRVGARPNKQAIRMTTAAEVYGLIADRLPARGQVQLDVTRLEIKPGKTVLRGTAETRKAVGEVVEALQQEPCFAEVSSGRISEVAEGKKQFALTLTTSCF